MILVIKMKVGFNMINTASLFAGVGGVCLGFKQSKYGKLRYKLKWANEIDDFAVETYKYNFKHPILHGDIRKIVDLSLCESQEIEYYSKLQEEMIKYPIDVLTGGFPCQAFSVAGERKGFQDHRGNLFWSIVDTVKLLEKKHKKPGVLFLENVKNLAGHDGGRTFSIIKSELENLGYYVKTAVLNTKEYTEIPQNRERFFIVCFLDKDQYDRFDFFDRLEQFKVEIDEETRKKRIEKIISDWNNNNFLNKYYYTKQKYPKYFLDEDEYNSQHESEKKEIRVNMAESVVEKYEFYQIRRGMYIRKNKNGVCPTLTANMGTGGHNVPVIKVDDGIRKLTPTETFKLQGFPIGDGYDLPSEIDGKEIGDCHFYKQAGNAVTVDVIKLIATEILKSYK